MIAVVQRVGAAKVMVGDKTIAEIGTGLLVLVGVESTDTVSNAKRMAKKIFGMRIFEDAQGKMNLSAEQMGGGYLLVSQFTLCADTSKGKRPAFDNAMKPPMSLELFNNVVMELERISGKPVATGKFGETMKIHLVNEGPATFILNT